MFIVLLTTLVKASSHTKGASLSNQKCEVQPTTINFHPNGYTQESYYYPFVVNLDRYVGSCNTLKDTLKTFDNFKNCMSHFFICKSMYSLNFFRLIHYTLTQKTNVKKKILNVLFFLRGAPTYHSFIFQFEIFIRAETQDLSL